MLVFLHRSLSRWRSDEGGLTLVEILAAIFILSVAVLSLAASAATSIRSVRVSRDRQQATQLATTTLEGIRALSYQDIVLDAADSPPSTFPAGDPPEDETVVSGTGGAVDHVQTVGPHTITTYVTYTNADLTQKRVVAEVSWTDGGTERTVRQETLVADATRGLAAPSFVVSQPNPEQGVTGESVCFLHTLNNTGGEDSYSWELFAADLTTGDLVAGTPMTRSVREPSESGSAYTVATREGFRIPASSNTEARGWFGWAWMGDPLAPMEDTTGDLRPDSADPVEELGSTKLNVCYTPLNQTGGLTGLTKADDTAIFTVRVYSAFDETVTTANQGNPEITNTVEVRDPLYLHHDGLIPHVPSTVLSMDGTAPSGPSQDYDEDTILGLGLSGASGESVTWSHTFGENSQIAEIPVLRLWTRAATVDETDLVFDLRLELECQVVNDALTPCNGATADDVVVLADLQDVTVEDVTDTWQLVTVSLPVDLPLNVSAGDSLRLVVACDPSSDSDCHIDYDVHDSPAVIRDSHLALDVSPR